MLGDEGAESVVVAEIEVAHWMGRRGPVAVEAGGWPLVRNWDCCSMWSINRSVILGVAIAAGATGAVETCQTFGGRAVGGRAVGGVVLIL